MDSFFSRYKSALVLLGILLAQVIGLASQMKRVNYASRPDGHNTHTLRAWTAYTVTPVEQLMHNSGRGIRNAWHSYIDLRHIRQHDIDLQYQIDQLRLHDAALAEDARQGQRLRALLAFQQAYIGHTVAAQIVGTGGGDTSRILVLDKGSSDGIRPDMAVITPDGVVGKIRDVFSHSSQVLLLNDPSSGAGVVLMKTRSRGILRGVTGGRLQIVNLLPDERIKPGEGVITSGGDRVFPRGLSVGSVDSVGLDPDHPPYAAIIIKPSANLDRLEEVLVVTDAATLLAAGSAEAATDAEKQRSAEMNADRLPGLKTGSDVAAGDRPGAAPASAQPVVSLPKPIPTVHTDRYSPGSAPPAADLQPGATTTTLATPSAPALRPPAAEAP